MTYRNLLCALVIILSLSAFQARATTFKIATLSPDGSSWMTHMREAAKSIKEQTDGRVKFKFYPGGVMGSDQTVMRKIKLKQLHGAALTNGSLSSSFAGAHLYSLPAIFNSQDEIDYVRAKMDDKIRNGLNNNGFVALGFAGGGFAYLLSKEEINTVGELQDHKVWIPDNDKISIASIKALDIKPVPLPIGDVLTGLQTGLVDTVANSPVATIVLQWHTQVKYLIDVPITYLFASFVLDKKAFNKISKSDQTIVTSEVKKAFDAIDQSNRDSNDKALKALQNRGVKLVNPTTEVKKEWRAKANNAIKSLVAAGDVPKPLVTELNQHLADYRSQNIN